MSAASKEIFVVYLCRAFEAFVACLNNSGCLKNTGMLADIIETTSYICSDDVKRGYFK